MAIENWKLKIKNKIEIEVGIEIGIESFMSY